MPYDPLSNAITGKTRLVLAHDVDIPRDEFFKQMDLFFQNNPQYKPSDCPFLFRHRAMVTLDVPEPSVGIGIHRLEPYDKLFTLRDVRVMELLSPHIIQAIKTIVLSEELAQYKSLSEKLAESSTAIALLRPDMRVIFRNRAFYDLLQIDPGGLLPGKLADLLQRESAKYDPPYEAGHSIRELPFFTLPQGVFRMSLTALKGLKQDSRYLLRLKPAMEPYSKMNLLMQESRLKPREMEVAVLVKDGMTNQEIANRLFISPLTVKTHLQSIYPKLAVTSRAKMVAVLNR